MKAGWFSRINKFMPLRRGKTRFSFVSIETSSNGLRIISSTNTHHPYNVVINNLCDESRISHLVQQKGASVQWRYIKIYL
jgi:hypothetical protein